jgi:hypothetical protein
MDGPMLWPGPHSSVDQLIEVIVMRKDDVAAHVEEEAFRRGVGASETTCLRGPFDEEPILMLELIQTRCSPKTYQR